MNRVFLGFLVAFNLFICNSNCNKNFVFRESGKNERRKDYVKNGRPQLTQLHEVIAIKQQNLKELRDILFDVSEIDSINYGKHRTRDEVGKMIENIPATNAVVNWLQSNNAHIVSQSIYGEYITAIAELSIWERLFDTTFYINNKIIHQSNSGGIMIETIDQSTTVIRADSYSVPIELDQHIHAVFRVAGLPSAITTTPHQNIDHSHQILKDSLISKEITISSNNYVTPINLASIYNIYGTGNSLGSQTAYGTVNITFAQSDVNLFRKYFNLTAETVSVIGYAPNSAACSNPTTEFTDCAEVIFLFLTY